MSSGSQTILAVGVGLLLALAAGGCSLPSAPPPARTVRPAVPSFIPAPAKPTPPPSARGATPQEHPRLHEGHVTSMPELIGLSEEEVVRLLGAAGNLREEPPATVWEYRTSDCALNLFFYMDMETRRFRALAYDASTTDGSTGDRALSLCLEQIMDHRHE